MLRKPIGPYQVGVRFFDTDLFGEEPVKRKLPVMVYYPADETGTKCIYKTGEYLRELQKTGKAYIDVITNSYENVPLSTKQDSYPVMIYSHGYGSFMMDSTMVCEDLASSGYIIFNIGHPYGSDLIEYADGTILEHGHEYEGESEPSDWKTLLKLILTITPFHSLKKRCFSWEKYCEDHAKNIRKILPLWREDMKKMMDDIFSENYPVFLRNKLRLSNGIGLIGTSLGGCCSIDVALTDPRAAYGINFDGSLFCTLKDVHKEEPLLVLCQRFNWVAFLTLKKLGCQNLSVVKFDGVNHWQMADGVYLTDKGKKHRKWADKVSKRKSYACLEFIENIKKD